MRGVYRSRPSGWSVRPYLRRLAAADSLVRCKWDGLGPRGVGVSELLASVQLPLMIFHPRERFLWRLRTRGLALGERTAIMAILNVTPDSFSGDGLLGSQTGSAHARVVAAALSALEAGADILDLGAESTRPGAAPLSAEAEQQRLLPALEAVLLACPGAIISVDTYHASTANAAVQVGAEIINDVSGFAWDPCMAGSLAAAGCGLVLMHTRGRPGEWALQRPLEPGSVLPTVFAGLCERLALAEAAGITSDRIVLDPGFGFGKRGGENVELLAGLDRLVQLGRPLLAGLSRKRFLSEVSRPSRTAPVTSASPPLFAEARLLPSVTGNVVAILGGAHVVRVHDVAETRQAVAVADAVLATRVAAHAG